MLLIVSQLFEFVSKFGAVNSCLLFYVVKNFLVRSCSKNIEDLPPDVGHENIEKSGSWSIFDDFTCGNSGLKSKNSSFWFRSCTNLDRSRRRIYDEKLQMYIIEPIIFWAHNT